MEGAVAERARYGDRASHQNRPGERQVAAMLTKVTGFRRRHIAFGPIVAAGPNSALPHATPTDRKLQRGDLLVVDWGVYVDDYPSDLTRTFAVGEIDPELRRVYDTVRLANEAARQAARPGVSGREVDRAAREVIEDAGYGEYFIHRTGHGLGLEVHEAPDASQPTPGRWCGNVFTIEPGIYLCPTAAECASRKHGGDADGCRTMSGFSRDRSQLDRRVNAKRQKDSFLGVFVIFFSQAKLPPFAAARRQHRKAHGLAGRPVLGPDGGRYPIEHLSVVDADLQ
jgi:hypothetical protein